MAAAVENDPKILMIRRLNSSLTESIDSGIHDNQQFS